MTTWQRNELLAARRRCVLDISAIADGSWAPLATDLTGKIFFRAGGTSWAAASGTATNTGYDGHWIYEATQGETDLSVNEIELRVVDATYYAQTLVQIDQYSALTATAAALATAQTAITDIQGDVDGIETTVATLATSADLATAQADLDDLQLTSAAILAAIAASFSSIATAVWDEILGDITNTTASARKAMRRMYAVTVGDGLNIKANTTPQVFFGEDGTTHVVSSTNVSGTRTNTITDP